MQLNINSKNINMKMPYTWRTAGNRPPQLIILLTPLLQLNESSKNVIFLKNLTENTIKLNFRSHNIHGTNKPAVCIIITFIEFVPEDGK